MGAWSGQITVTTAGEAVQGPDVLGEAFIWAPHPSNSGTYVWSGDDGAGDVDDATGFPLAVGDRGGKEASEPNAKVNLNTVWFDVGTSGDKICWQRVR